MAAASHSSRSVLPAHPASAPSAHLELIDPLTATHPQVSEETAATATDLWNPACDDLLDLNDLYDRTDFGMAEVMSAGTNLLVGSISDAVHEYAVGTLARKLAEQQDIEAAAKGTSSAAAAAPHIRRMVANARTATCPAGCSAQKPLCLPSCLLESDGCLAGAAFNSTCVNPVCFDLKVFCKSDSPAGAWPGTPIRDTSCCDHLPTGVPNLRPGPRRGQSAAAVPQNMRVRQPSERGNGVRRACFRVPCNTHTHTHIHIHTHKTTTHTDCQRLLIRAHLLPRVVPIGTASVGHPPPATPGWGVRSR